MSGTVGTNSGRGSGTIGTASAGADTSLSNLATAGQKLVPQAWATFDGTGTVALTDTGGINPFSSLADVAMGRWNLTFTSANANATYCTIGSTIGSDSGSSYWSFICSADVAATTTVVYFDAVHHAGTLNDFNLVSILVFGD